MEALIRERSVQVKVGEGSNIFQLLSEIGVLPTDHMIAIQQLPGHLCDITFMSKVIRQRFWPDVQKNFTATAYAEDVKIVTVLHVPHELDENVVRLVLGKFAKYSLGNF